MRERSNRLVSRVPKDLLIALLVLSASLASFGLGVLSARDMSGKGNVDTFRIDSSSTTNAQVLGASAALAGQDVLTPKTVEQATIVSTQGVYVASKTGKRYYLPTCSGAKRIKKENRISFSSLEEAKASGRTPASNCKGL